MKVSLQIVVVLFCLVSSVAAWAEQDDLRVQQIDVDQNLSFYHVTDIIQDSRGFIWISTLNGLNRFDGNSMINYHKDLRSGHGLKTDRIISLSEGTLGNIWAGTGYGGIEIFNIETEKFINVNLDVENAFNNVVQSISRLSNHDMICGTRGGELYRIPNEFVKELLNGNHSGIQKLTLVSTQNNFSIDRIIKIVEGNNELWLIDWQKRVFRVDYSKPKASEYLVREIDTKGARCNSVIKDEANNIVFATSEGIRILPENKGDRTNFNDWITVQNSLPLHVTALTLNPRGGIWFSTDDNGLNRVENYLTDKPEIVKYKTQMIPTAQVEIVDKSNVLWCKSYKAGVYYTELSVKDFEKHNFLNTVVPAVETRHITDAISDGNGYLWTAFDENHVVVTEFETGKFVFEADWIKVLGLFEDSKGFIWIITAQGLYMLDHKDPEFPRFYDDQKLDFSEWGYEDLIGMRFNSISEDCNGNIWLAGDRDLVYVIRNMDGDIEGIKVLTREDDTSLSPCDIQKIQAHPKENQLWVLQRGCGVTLMNYSEELDNINFEALSFYIDDETSIASGSVNSILFEENVLWLATDNGLNKVFYSSENRYELKAEFGEEHGLPTSPLHSIKTSSTGQIWMGTNKGLVYFNKQTERFRAFTKRDGLLSNVFTPAAFLYKDGSLVFGTIKGLISFHPDELEINIQEPLASFTSLSVFNNPVKPGQELNGRVILDESISSIDRLVINHKENDFTIGFAALHYAIPKKNRYRYFLEGYHNEWIITNQRKPFASFANLNPGNYILRLRACNNDGVWMNEEQTLEIRVLPPPWKTLWAYVLYFILLLGVTYVIMRIWGARIKLRNEIFLEKSKREKEAELSEMKFRYFTDISHEFRTPLTLIHGPVRELMEEFKSNDKINQILVPLNLNINRMLRLLNQLLDFRKAESDKLKLNVRKGDVIPVLRNIYDSYSEVAQSKNIDFKFDAPTAEFTTWFDEDKLEKIVHNLLSNAFKYTPGNGKVELKFEEKAGNEIKIIVRDTGKGIAPENQQKIFDRFFQEEEQTGTGIGLALVKKLVEIHKGAIKVESTPGKGSVFTVELKVGEEPFFEEIQNQVAKEGMEKAPVWIGAQPKDEVFEESSIQKEDVPLIMIVEDDDEIRSYLQRLLKSRFRTIVAENGLKGEENAKEFLPDMILSDVLMPEQDGIEMCRNLKQDNNTSHIPIIFLTAKTSEQDKLEGLNIGATDYLIKPFDPTELKIKVENILKDLRQNRDKLRRDFILNPSVIKVESPEEIFMQKAVKIVEENMSDGNFNLVFMCEELGISRMQLHRKLKSLTGQSTTEFIRSIRLKRAAQLLESGHLTALEVMYEVGIESSSYFSKAFKKQYGIPPTEYSEKYQSKKT